MGEKCVVKFASTASIAQIQYRGWILGTPLRMMKRSESLVSDESLSLCLDLKGLPRLLLQVFQIHLSMK